MKKRKIVNNIIPRSSSSRKAAARLRTAGVLVLLLGLGVAGLVAWKGAPPPDLSGDVATARTSKKQARAIEVNVGKMGLFMDGLMEDFQDPGAQAVAIAAVSIFVAGGCFYFSRLLARDSESNGPVH